MAGGSGSRFWPLTREDRPFQFIRQPGSGTSVLRQTYDRFLKFIPKDRIIVVTLDRYADSVNEILPELPEENLLREPYSRHTAPCIAYAAYTLLKRDPEAVMIVSPSDLFISDEGLFSQTVLKAASYADENEVLMTLGIVPNSPATAFGYIQVKGGKAAAVSNKPLKVKTFTEKPDAALANIFFRSGEFFWNSGIFLWSADVIREEMERLLPEVTQFFTGWEGAIGTPYERDFILKAYGDCPKVSVDYGVMEKTERAWLYPARFGWKDISEWDSLNSVVKRNSEGNIVLASHCMTKDCHGDTIITSNKDKLLVVKGLENFMVIDTPDTIVICPKDDNSLKELHSAISGPDFDKYR